MTRAAEPLPPGHALRRRRYRRATEGVTLASFAVDKLRHKAVIRDLEVWVRRRRGFPTSSADWRRRCRGATSWRMRNKLIHGYFGMDLAVVHHTATVDIPRPCRSSRRSRTPGGDTTRRPKPETDLSSAPRATRRWWRWRGGGRGRARRGGAGVSVVPVTRRRRGAGRRASRGRRRGGRARPGAARAALLGSQRTVPPVASAAGAITAGVARMSASSTGAIGRGLA